jgi:hypothetical protein
MSSGCPGQAAAAADFLTTCGMVQVARQPDRQHDSHTAQQIPDSPWGMVQVADSLTECMTA